MSDISPETTTRPAKAPRPWLMPAFLASLALNLAVVGLAAGMAIRGPQGIHGADPARDGGFRALIQAMPGDERRALGRDLWSHREQFRAGRAAMQSLRLELAAALTARPFDMAGVEAAFADQRQSLSRMAEQGFDAVIARIAGMDEAERAEFARNLLAGR
jgi:uncharacterized membrane protein